MIDFEDARRQMVAAHLVRRGIGDDRVLEAMGAVPREMFVPPDTREFAYEDAPLAIGEGQTISQPYVVALMVQAARIEPDDHVLEVGAGSGYAAAIMGRLARSVHAIERHAALGEAARQRLAALGLDTVSLRIGDGSVGWPEQAPFDAIIVAASGPSVPMALMEQLAIGGRLIIPLDKRERYQRLVRVTRVSADHYEEEDLGGVMFVPLIGEQGWSDRTASSPQSAPKALPQRIADAAEPLPDPADPCFGSLFDSFGDKRVVLLGEASHGTSQFYTARAAITKRLIAEHGFSIVAVEADWPDAAAVDRWVRGKSPAPGQSPPFQRFPTWMWRNREFEQFLVWLKARNATEPAARQAGFYGLDLYNLSGSIAAVLAYLDDADPQAARVARERYGCLTPWQNEPSTYGRAALTSGYASCEAAVVQQCRDLLERQLQAGPTDGEALLDAAQNARLVASAEKYYRVMYYGGATSWNLRDRHMFETLEHLFEAKGPGAKAVVWAHNSHIGDARQTEMGSMRDEINIGQLCRERFGEDAALIGFGTDSGTVAAATDWDGEMEIKTVRPALGESVERCFHLAGTPRCLVDFSRHPALAQALAEPRLERFIGVIYRPETERYSHYQEARLSRQFDAYVWFDRTSAVTPLASGAETAGVPETFPFGL